MLSIPLTGVADGTFANANSAVTTFTMPNNVATVTATYRASGGNNTSRIIGRRVINENTKLAEFFDSNNDLTLEIDEDRVPLGGLNPNTGAA